MTDERQNGARRDEDRRLVRVEADVDELAAAVLGTKASDLHGGGRLDDGLVHHVADIRRKVNGGGLSQADKWRLIVSTVGSLLAFAGVIFAAVILN